MPNQNFCGPREDLIMGDCSVSLPYTSSKAEGKLCKYSYASWCPTCDKDSPRRRSKSETNEPCKRKGKEMKSLTPKKFDKSQECENMDLEYETKDSRYDFYRIRSNLCELPTTYITNNCQITAKLSNATSDFIDYIEKNTKHFEGNTKFTNLNDQMHNFNSNTADKPKNGYESNAKLLPKKFDVKPHYANSFAYRYTNKSLLNDAVHIKHLEFSKHPVRTKSSHASSTLKQNDSPEEPKQFFYKVERQCSGTKQFGDFKSCADKPNGFHNLKFHENPSKPNICYDTCTFFDKKYDTTELHDRYTKEVELLRGKLRELTGGTPRLPHNPKARPVSENKSQRNVTSKSVEVLAKTMPSSDLDNPSVKAGVPEEELPPVPVSSRPNGIRTAPKITLKTRSKVSVVKIKKLKNKPLKLVPVDSKFTDSEYSDSEDSEKEDVPEDETDSNSEASLVSTGKEESAKPIASASLIEQDSGDSLPWPIRESLFPNIPPYISFNSYDAEMPFKLPRGRRFLKWKLTTITPVLVRKTLSNTGFRLVRKSNEWVGTWGKHMKSPLFKTLKDTQKINHFPGTFQIGRKDRLWRNFQKLITKFGNKEFGFLPQTYVLPQDLKSLKQNWEYKNGSGNEMWIIKPPASARGVGIKVINKWSQLPKRMSLVVQKYISNPYLINGSKFDLRLYVLVTSFNPLRIYLYPEGLARFASTKYSGDAKDLKDRYMHLTNYSINKLSSQYTANEDANACQGHKWTISKLLEYMEKEGIDTKALWRNLQQLVIKTIISGENPITQLCQENMISNYNCYELFGVDVLLDERLKPWLLEVNISPSLHSASPLDAHVKGPLVKCMFDMAQFHLPPRLSKMDKNTRCFESKLYTTGLTRKERNKHNNFCQMELREEYLTDILDNLTGDDVRHLVRYEDELTVMGQFEKIFPTSHTHKYLQFLDAMYYNRLFDAWETKYEKNRAPGIKILQSLCASKVHLKTAPPSTLDKNLSNMNLGEPNLLPSRTGQSHPVSELPDEGKLLSMIVKNSEERMLLTKEAVKSNLLSQYLAERNLLLVPFHRTDCVS